MVGEAGVGLKWACTAGREVGVWLDWASMAGREPDCWNWAVPAATLQYPHKYWSSAWVQAAQVDKQHPRV